MKDRIIAYIREELKKLEYKDDKIKLEFVNPTLLEEVLGEFEDGYELNGYDCDYWAETNEYSIFGTMSNGTATITKKKGKVRVKPSKNKNDNKQNKVTKITELKLTYSELQEKLFTGALSEFYLVRQNNEYTRLYASDEAKVRQKAMELYGHDWDRIYTEESFNEVLKKWQQIDCNKYKESGYGPFILA